MPLSENETMLADSISSLIRIMDRFNERLAALEKNGIVASDLSWIGPTHTCAGPGCTGEEHRRETEKTCCKS